MRADILEIWSTRSTRVLLLLPVILFVLLGVASATIGDGKQSNDVVGSAVLGTDTVPLIFALFGVVGVSGVLSRGSISYSLLTNPRRENVLLGRTIASVLMSMLAALLAFLITVGFVAVLLFVREPAGMSLNAIDLLVRGASLVLLAGLFTALGCGIGFLVQSTAGSVFTLLALILFLPIGATVLGLWNAQLSSAVLQASPGFLITAVAGEIGADWARGLVGLLIWASVALLAGLIQFRRYTP